MRITTVKHSLKKLTCGKCGETIKPSRDEIVPKKGGGTKTVRVLGDGYRWIKFRRGPRKVRCMKPACAFRDSDLTTSDKLARVYDARDTLQEAIGAWEGGSTDDLTTALSDCASEIREVAEEYEESASNIEQSFTGGSATADECREKSESLAGWADELEEVSFDEWEPEEVEGEEEEDQKNSDGQTKEDWMDAQRSAAEDAAGNCPV